MKKLIALIMATGFLLGAVSCSGGSKKEKEVGNLVAEKMSVAYKRSKIDNPTTLQQIYTFKTYNGGENIFILGFGATIPEFYTVDKSFTDFKLLEIPEFDIGVSYDLDITDDGTIVSVVNSVDYGNLPTPDYSSPDYDEELYDRNAQYTLKVNTYSVEGKLLSSCPLEDFPVTPDKSTSTQGLVTDGENVIVNLNGEHHIIKTDGTYVGRLSDKRDTFKLREVGKDREGNLVCAMIDFDADKLELCGVDMSTGEFTPAENTYSFAETVSSEILPGTGDYSMFITSMTTVYGIRSDDSSIEQVFSIIDSNLNSNNIGGFYLEADGNVVIPDNGDMFSLTFRRFTECDPAELENIPTITIASFYERSWGPVDIVNNLNDTQTDFRAEYKFYCPNDATAEEGNEAFAQDVVSGNLPDILYLNNCSHMGSVNMKEQGGLCDLYEFMDKEGSTLTRDMLIPNVAELLETDGKMYCLAPNFSIDLGYVIKTENASGIEKWDYDTYSQTYMNLPEGMGLDNYYTSVADTKYTRYANLMIGTQFIDYENATCSFDSDKCIEYLKYCDLAPLEVEYVEHSEEEAHQNFIDQQRAIRDDTALLHYMGFGIYESYYRMKYGTFGGEDFTILGNPGKDGGEIFAVFDSGYAITENSPNKDLAWSIISSLCEDEYYDENTVNFDRGVRYTGSFPITQSGLEVLAENEQTPRNNSSFVLDPTYTGLLEDMGGEYAEMIGSITPEEIEEVNEIIYSLDKTEEYRAWDDTFHTIMWEEIDRFFNGDCTAEECADALQSRLSIYIAEKSWDTD